MSWSCCCGCGGGGGVSFAFLAAAAPASLVVAPGATCGDASRLVPAAGSGGPFLPSDVAAAAAAAGCLDAPSCPPPDAAAAAAAAGGAGPGAPCAAAGSMLVVRPGALVSCWGGSLPAMIHSLAPGSTQEGQGGGQVSSGGHPAQVVPSPLPRGTEPM